MSPPSGFGGGEDYLATAIIQAEESTHNLRQEGVSMSVPQGQAHQFTRIDKMLNGSVPSALPRMSGTPAAVRNQQGTPHGLHQQFQHVGKGPAAMSSRSSRQAGVHGSPTRRYSCDMCDKHYAQPQGLTRHRRETHKPSLCRHCGVFEWGRPYVLKEHLGKWHPGVNPDAELEEIKHNSRSTTTYLPQISSSTPELERWGRAEFQLHPPTLLPSAMIGLPSVPPPAFLPVAYRPQFEFAELTSMKNKGQIACQFAALNSSCARTPFPLIEERSRMAQDLDVYARFAHAWSIQYS